MNLDVAVVGASSAGLYAAENLARAGRRVAVFEQQPVLVPARRTLIVTPQLQRVLGYLPDAAVVHRVAVMDVASPGARVRVDLREPDPIVERSRLIALLAERASAAGAVLHLGYRFQAIAPAPEGAVLTLRRADGTTATVVARAAIGADGVVSDVAAAVGLDRPLVAPIIQAEVELPPDWPAALTRVWFDTDETRFFYWLIPESKDRGVLGVVGDDRAETRVLLDRFLARQGFRPLAYQAAQVALYHPRLRACGRIGAAPVLLVGDAAGHVKVTTVGGTVSGLWGAAAAARALLCGGSYAHELRPLKRELDVHWLMRLFLDRLDNAGYDRLVRALTPALRRFLGRRNRDEMAGAIWKLPLYQPWLLAEALGLLLHRPGGRPRPPTDRVPVAEPK
ncbi:MAG: NAD(P)/FAD-dependent oxidoreductase [Chloroflexi bacterium]|nr:NAD(P)/FAD-dependent oxidoreductase [Chloroflexota bacterium]